MLFIFDSFQILAAVIGHAVVKAQIASRPDMKNLRSGRVLVDIDNPETHQSQYHTADFDRSKYRNGISLLFCYFFFVRIEYKYKLILQGRIIMDMKSHRMVNSITKPADQMALHMDVMVILIKVAF